MFKNLDAKALGLSATQSETIELALSFGFRSIHVDLVDFSREVASSGLPKARRLLDSAKLKVGTFDLPIDWQHAKDFKSELTKLADFAQLAASIGAKRAVTVIEPASDERPYHENFAFYGERLSELGKALEQHGLKLAVGFDSSESSRQGKAFEFVRDFDALTVLLSTVGAANVGLWLDVWHVWACGLPLDDVCKKLKRGQVAAISLSDAADESTADRHNPTSRRLPGETGIIDCTSVLTTQAALGYDGPVTPVAGQAQIASLRRDQLVKLAGTQLDTLWKAAGLGPAPKMAATASR
jgi:sugar phosphate isomerase/epimerase